MPISTYSELTAAIADFLNRGDLTAAIPSFVALAEADIQRRLRHWKMEKRVTGTLDTQFSVTPSDWVETMRFSLTEGSTSPLTLISHDDLLDRKARAANQSGKPQHYVMTGSQFEYYPVPDAEYVAELVYISRIPALSGANPQNWLLTDAPDIYLYGSLMHSAPYLKDDERIAIWAELYSAGIEKMNEASDRARYSGRGLKMRTRGY